MPVRERDVDGPIHVVHVDDDPQFGELVATRLRRERSDLQITTVERPAAVLDALEDRDVDCVVSDHEMPGMNGLELLAAVREVRPGVPFVLYTGAGSETLASEAISAGVDAYMPKHGPGDDVEVLLQRIETLVAGARAETSYREVFEKAAVAMSVRDPETGRFLDANEQYCELMGYDRDEIASLTSAEVGVDEGAYTTDRAHELLRRTVEEGPRTVEWVNERRDGSQVQVESTLKPAEIDGRTLVLVTVEDVTEQREREAELERKNDLLARTQRLARVGGWELDVDAGTLRWTDEIKRIHAVPLDAEPDLERSISFYHPDDRDTVREAFQAAIEDGEAFELSARIVTDEGDPRWVYVQGEPRTDPGASDVIRGTLQDITERRRREQRIRRLQHRTHDLMRTADTTRIAEIAVETAETALGLPLSGVHLDDGSGVLRGVAGTEKLRSAFGGVPDYHRGAGASSDIVWGVFQSGETLVVDDTGEYEGLEGASPMQSGVVHPLGDHGVFITSSTEPAAFDETDEALAEMLATATTAALDRADRERRYDAIFNQTFQFTGLMDTDGTLLEANEAALVFGGIDRESVVGTPIWESPWFRDHDEARRVARESVERAATGEFYRDEILVQGAEETAVIDYSVRPVTDDRGDVVLLVPEGRDITELKEREEELERKNEQLEEFASVISHDLRNPLSVAAGRLELAREAVDNDDLDHVARAHDRMQSLIDDLLELARQGESVDSLDRVDLDGLAREAWRNVDTGGATLRIESTGGFEADRNRTIQLFENLVRNAVDHAGPEVTVTVGTLADGFFVEDDGPGIPPDRREDVFDTGFTTSEQGTGFGLRIVERVATAHGWSISVTAGVDGGARFEVTGVELSTPDEKTV